MSAYTRPVWRQTTLAMAEEYLDSINDSDALRVKGNITYDSGLSNSLVERNRLRLLIQMGTHLEAELNILMEAGVDS